WATWDAIGIQAVPKKNTFAQQGAPSSRYDLGAEVSGPIIKDKLFYFVGLDLNRTEPAASQANLSGNLRTGKETIDSTQFVGKLNWYVAPDHQLTFAVNANILNDDNHGAIPSTRGNADFGYASKSTVTNISLNWDWTINSALFLSVKAGQAKTDDKTTPDSNLPLIVDGHWYAPAIAASGVIAGPGYGVAGAPPAGTAYNRGGFDIYSDETVTANQFKADLNWYLGTHSLKFGVGMLTSEYMENQRMTGGFRATIDRRGRTVTIQRNSTDATVKAEYQHIYAQDAWEIFGGFKAYYGFRFETQNQKDYNGKSFMKFDSFADYVQPRVGFTWDINNDGKSKLSASYGTYFEQIPQRMAIRVFANEIYTRDRYTRTQGVNMATGDYSADGLYTDGGGNATLYTYSHTSDADWGTLASATPNGAFAYPGGVNPYTLAQLGVAPVGTDTGTSVPFLSPAHSDYAIPFSYDPIAEGTKLTKRDEYTLGFDQTFGNGFTVGLHYKYRVLENPIEDSVITDAAGNVYDPGADAGGGVYFGQAILWNPGRTAAWTSRNVSGIPNTRFDVANTLYDKAGNTYRAYDVVVSKISERTSLTASYTWSQLKGNYEGLVSSSNGQADANITASMDYYPYVGYGLLPLDRTHVVKVFGSHRFELGPGDLNVGFNWTAQSGTPKSYFDDGSASGLPDVGQYGNATPLHNKYGSEGRTPATFNMDLHLDYALKLGKKIKVVPSADVFNLFNQRYATSVFQTATDSSANPRPAGYYGAASNWQTGRRFRFGFKVQF
ncbi:MAG TPA: TonB-dependent receptor, partial [Holophagaceae bacterium]|nr:TonB-dependent receptor [Holophagaceae bacterium]